MVLQIVDVLTSLNINPLSPQCNSTLVYEISLGGYTLNPSNAS